MADERKPAVERPTLQEGETPYWALRRAAWAERQRGEEGYWFTVLRLLAVENARGWLAQQRWIEEFLDFDPRTDPRATAEWPWADEQEIPAGAVPALAQRLNAMARAGAVLRIWDRRWKVLLMEGYPGPIDVAPLKDLPGVADLYPDCPGRVLVLDGFGARLSFRFARRAEGMADPGRVTVDVLGTIEDIPERWVGGGLRFRVELAVKDEGRSHY
ncbi:MAG: hypothetical protein DIU69_08060 [Bacillota bacterium]|nr:MAG: hypothetical protein DIU69_08060 [Bacillota bacterium]